MSNERFTQGEWLSHDHGVGELVVYTDDGDYTICSLEDHDEHFAWKDGYSVSPEAKANAHLISAAPDMYRALRYMVSSPSERRGDIVQVALTQAEVDDIRAALAKADGE